MGAVEHTVAISGRVLGDFVVADKLGEGGFGEVYRATQRTLQREAVVKILRAHHLTSGARGASAFRTSEGAVMMRA